MADDGPRRLRRSRDRMVAGVAGGIADYVAVDPTIVRLVFALLLILGAGITWLIVYLVLWVLMPEAPATESPPTIAAGDHDNEGGADPGTIFGILLVGLGVLFLANQFALLRFVGFGAARAAWPLLLIGAGAVLLLVARDRTRT
jgi:phage shock protein C